MRARTVARNTLWIGIDAGLNLASTATISIVAARVLGPDTLGPYNFAIWVAGLATYLVSLGVPAATGRFASELVGAGRPDQALGVVRLSLRFQAAFVTLATAAAVLLVYLFAPAEHRGYTALVILSLAPAALMGVFAAGIGASEEARLNVGPSLISTASGLAGSLYALLHARSLLGLAAAFFLSRVIDCLLRALAYRWVCRRHWPEVRASLPPPDVRARLRHFALGATALSLLAALVWDRSDIVFVNHFHDAREVAFFSVAANLAFQLLTVPQVFLNAAGMTMRVELGRNPEGLGRFVGIAIRYVALLALPLGLGIAALSPAIVTTLYGHAYEGAAVPLAIAGLFVAGRASFSYGRDVLLMRERYRELTVLALGTAVLAVSLDLALVPRGGARGAILANGLYHSAAAVAGWYLVARDLRMAMPWGRLGRIGLAAANMALLVGVTASALPKPAALLVGVPLGAALYLVGLRLLGGLDATDLGRLEALLGPLPRGARGFGRRVIRWLVKETGPAAASPAVREPDE